MKIVSKIIAKVGAVFILSFSSITLLSAADAEVVSVETGSLKMELNKLKQKEKTCVAYILLKNRSDREFSEFTASFYLFNKEGVISAGNATNFQKILAGKTVLTMVPMKDVACNEVSGILLNRIMACKSGSEDVAGCMQMVETSSKSPVELFK
ncbi:MAG: hypothetical protein HOM84_06145 [Thiotrichales bacterium]|jgi:hypothetical protein|nr:hypothetical protein [Thiotrichales bacterium]MBT3613895.1 hypothetical protein [Thiotrichales bacterium]MBT3752971.1 hypothetical protein [Thiotrichales bacterium]MBT3838189.1 hypothetical protein [Thiotrichales bacterium]MBT4151827.1 hypothetical protein [Thiotrichales bacterium]